jgi:hypothetical protein
MWRKISKATGETRTARNTSMAQLFGDDKHTAILALDVGSRGQQLAECMGEEESGGGSQREDGEGMCEDKGGSQEGKGRLGTEEEGFQGKGAESRPGLRCSVFPLYLFMEASRWWAVKPHQLITARRRGL